MSEVYTYSPSQVKIALGSHLVTGYADDSFVNIDPVGDGTTVKVGCDGSVIRSIIPGETYTIKLSVLQNSATNKFLDDCYKRDRKDGSGTFPVTVKDLMGKDQFTSPFAWVGKEASWGRGKEAGNREWEITCAHGEFGDNK